MHTVIFDQNYCFSLGWVVKSKFRIRFLIEIWIKTVTMKKNLAPPALGRCSHHSPKCNKPRKLAEWPADQSIVFGAITHTGFPTFCDFNIHCHCKFEKKIHSTLRCSPWFHEFPIMNFEFLRQLLKHLELRIRETHWMNRAKTIKAKYTIFQPSIMHTVRAPS